MRKGAHIINVKLGAKPRWTKTVNVRTQEAVLLKTLLRWERSHAGPHMYPRPLQVRRTARRLSHDRTHPAHRLSPAGPPRSSRAVMAASHRRHGGLTPPPWRPHTAAVGVCPS